ncbi:MAG: DUF58 domain-containing protein [Pyrinomonadaceae bacterium]
MNFVFSKRFYFLFLLGLVPLLFVSHLPILRWLVLIFDLFLILLACYDNFSSKKASKVIRIERLLDERYPVNDKALAKISVVNEGEKSLEIRIKDEIPFEVLLKSEREARLRIGSGEFAEFEYEFVPRRRGKFDFGKIAVQRLSQFGLVWTQEKYGNAQSIMVFPNLRRARELELKALGANNYLAVQRRSIRKGEGREFESLREYVRGDELRHISWTATARRSKLTTRQYQVERDQTIITLVDCGRMMTARIDHESKFDVAVEATLALTTAVTKGGDYCGIAIFGRKIKKYIPPKKGISQVEAAAQAFYDIEPALIESSYSRAFQFVSANLKKRAFVIILTDLVDRDSSKELIKALRLLRPRHLPLVVTIGDRDLNKTVSTVPTDIDDVFTQSAAEEVIYQRDAALRQVEMMGGLALDVTTATLAPELLQTYLRVKDRGLI